MQRKQNLKSTSYQLPAKSSHKIAIVVSEFSSDITMPMKDGAVVSLKKYGIPEKNISVVNVPGAFEIPIACKRLAKTKKYAGIVAIGCVIRGDTDHYVFIAGESARGVMSVMLEENIPIANAILTVNNLEQAKARSEGNMNKGIEAVEALLKFLSIKF